MYSTIICNRYNLFGSAVVWIGTGAARLHLSPVSPSCCCWLRMNPFDHWTTTDLGERLASERLPPPNPLLIPQQKSPLREGPRLNMWRYNYPLEFNLGANQRVRGLNHQLLWLYRLIASSIDNLRKQEEIYAHEGQDDYYSVRVACAKERLDDFLADIEPLLAEVSAIGGDFYIPPELQGTPELQGKILIKNYVEAGSLEYLTSADHFFQEELGDVVDERHERSLGRLQLVSQKVNRLTFLQHCGVEYTRPPPHTPENSHMYSFYLLL